MKNMETSKGFNPWALELVGDHKLVKGIWSFGLQRKQRRETWNKKYLGGFVHMCGDHLDSF